jgi:uncharacterized protein YigA (DUF484 family)
MPDDAQQALDIARYLKAHPEFFLQYGEVLAGVSIPHAHGGRAISLQERQLEVLREKNRALEARLAELVRLGQENEAITGKLQAWTRGVLLEDDPARLPAALSEGLAAVFSVPQVALRLWRVREAYRDLPQAAEVTPDAVTLATSMKQPYCGPNQQMLAAAWLPGEGADTRSLALLPLRRGADPEAFGMLVLGSADAERFRAGMGTAFLERIAETASAALSRLIR